MRNLIIAGCMVAGLVLIGIGAKYGWDLLSQPAVDANGKMDGPARDAYIKSSVAACVRQRPASMDEGKFRQACICYSEKAVDLLTMEEAKTIDQTGEIPAGLVVKLQEPIKQCMVSAGLTPAK